MFCNRRWGRRILGSQWKTSGLRIFAFGPTISWGKIQEFNGEKIISVAWVMTFICLGFQSEFLENCIPCRECENAILPEAALIQFSSKKPNSDSFRAKFYFSLQLCRTGSFARLQSALLYETPPIRVVILVGRPYSESPNFKTPEVRSFFFQ